MVKSSDVKCIFERASRLSNRIKKIKGEGAAWSYTFPDGLETQYILNGIKTHEELEDDIANVFIWLWNIKDYLKELLAHNGNDPKQIESTINSDQQMTICADVANWLKHGKLKISRSGLYPKLGKLSYRIPQPCINNITFSGSKIAFDFKEFELIEIKLPIVDKAGNEIVDAFALIDHALFIWDQELGKNI